MHLAVEGRMPGCEARTVLGLRVDATSYADASARIVAWARRDESRYVCIATVHTVMESCDDDAFRAAVEGADLVTPDGMPLVWALRLLGVPGASRVYGPDLMVEVCARAAEARLPIGLYGSTPEVLDRLAAVLARRFPGLPIAYRASPPFGPAEALESDADARAICASGVRILFVGLGCPKQERWMARRAGSLGVVMLGVGAAFDFLAGTKRQAPAALQRAGLEWAFRLACEPRRLWRRYLYHNPRFVARFARQLAARGAGGAGAAT